jgi:hypothetical protein
MNITKNQWIIIAVVGAVAIWYFFLRKKDTKESGYREKLGPKSNTGTSGTAGGTAKENCASHKCSAGFTATAISNGKCGCKGYRQGSQVLQWA